MATASSRKNIIAQLVAVLAAVTAGSTYFYTYTATNQVASTFDSDDARLQIAGLTLRVSDAQETHERRFADRDEMTTATLQLYVDVLLRHASGAGANLVNELQDVLHDLVLAVGANPTLNGSANDAFVDMIDVPGYSPEQNLAAVTVRVRVEYDYQPGVTV